MLEKIKKIIALWHRYEKRRGSKFMVIKLPDSIVDVLMHRERYESVSSLDFAGRPSSWR